MELTLDQALQKGIEAHRAGKAQEADRYYTAILKANPKHPDANHNMGVLAVGVGKVEEALPFFKIALEANPSLAQFWLSYIDALIKLDRIEDAKLVFDQAKSNGADGDSFDQLEKRLGHSISTTLKTQEPPENSLQLLLKLYNQGKVHNLLEQARQLLKDYPSSATIHNLLGAVNQKLGNLEEAVEGYRKAISFRPDHAEAYSNMGAALREQGKQAEALDVLNKAISIKPDYFQAYNNLGNVFRDQGQSLRAARAYEKVISIEPNYSNAYYNLGLVHAENNNLTEAKQAFKKAITIRPDYAEAYNEIGIILCEQDKHKEAIKSYKKAISIQPNYAEAYNNMGIAYRDRGKSNKAIEAFQKAITIRPDYARAFLNLSTSARYEVEDLELVRSEKLYNKNGLTVEARCDFSFALGKMYEDLGDFAKAFECFKAANTLRKKSTHYSTEPELEKFHKIKLMQKKLKSNSLTEISGDHGLLPVFVVGMPRSGTTLVEQVISSHSEVAAGGELEYVEKFGADLAIGRIKPTKKSIYKFRQDYINEVRKLSDTSRIITDKMPENFKLIPLICAAFPEAKIIHVSRSACATCWSNFKTYFLNATLWYSHDLNDIVEYYNLYKDLMKFWQSQYGDRIYNLNYEDLTTDQENQTKKLIKYLELNWENACLSPHENKRTVRTASQQQVRQKIYKGSSEAWRNYEQYLNGAFDSLPSQ